VRRPAGGRKLWHPRMSMSSNGNENSTARMPATQLGFQQMPCMRTCRLGWRDIMGGEDLIYAKTTHFTTEERRLWPKLMRVLRESVRCAVEAHALALLWE
jgi:hypothetical protein